MKLFALLLIICASIFWLPVSAQELDNTPTEITPSNYDIVQVKLSPDGTLIAVMTLDYQSGDTYIDIWNTAETSHSKRLVKELGTFDRFYWSPNSQYIAVTARRSNASGNEFSLVIYDVMDTESVEPIFHTLGGFFGEFIPYEDTEFFPDYEPVWSADSRIIAVNFQDGIHFFDITDCTIDECKLLYVLDVGYVPWFDWQGNVLMTESGNTVQLWDVSLASP